MMFPALARRQLLANQSLLFENEIRLVSESVVTLLVQGTPELVTTEVVHWVGLGSVQYIRPRIQKPLASENSGIYDDPIAGVVYVPYDAAPNESMIVIDVDGAFGSPGGRYRQSRKPANVGGLDVYWECYVGAPSNV
jgi:hypothetical protein